MSRVKPRSEIKQELDAAKAEIEQMQIDHAAAIDAKDAEIDQAKVDFDSVWAELEQAKQEVSALTEERDQAKADHAAVIAERDEAVSKHAAAEKELETAKAQLADPAFLDAALVAAKEAAIQQENAEADAADEQAKREAEGEQSQTPHADEFARLKETNPRGATAYWREHSKAIIEEMKENDDA